MNEFERLNNLDEYTAFEDMLETMGEKERAPYVPPKPISEEDYAFGEACRNKEIIACVVCGQITSQNNCVSCDLETYTGVCRECNALTI